MQVKDKLATSLPVALGVSEEVNEKLNDIMEAKGTEMYAEFEHARLSLTDKMEKFKQENEGATFEQFQEKFGESALHEAYDKTRAPQTWDWCYEQVKVLVPEENIAIAVATEFSIRIMFAFDAVIAEKKQEKQTKILELLSKLADG